MRLLFSYGGADSREIQHLTGEDSEAHIKENFQDFQKRFQLVQNDCQLGPNLERKRFEPISTAIH